MRLLLFLLPLIILSGCGSNGYDRHYIVSEAIEEILPVPEED
ncbi:hypothetical protein [Simkania negevensis]|uniref:Lipoprotein n=1 Tax=Simkania negevensis (strain ATCC VR-1471 / DSM 27360 / Z) TaxID=331113 RepID=F8L651_SIMNZ|nr:hypothetical protein [Simkania negevensis]CCB90073.1 unknown protein [Simkania negevensis Z]